MSMAGRCAILRAHRQLCTGTMYSPAPCRAAPRPSERALPHGAGAQRVIDLTESVAGRGVRGFVAGPGRALVALGTDESRGAAKPQAKRVFSAADGSSHRGGRVPRPESRYLANYTRRRRRRRRRFAGAEHGSRLQWLVPLPMWWCGIPTRAARSGYVGVRRHGLAEIVERGDGFCRRLRVNFLHREQDPCHSLREHGAPRDVLRQ